MLLHDTIGQALQPKFLNQENSLPLVFPSTTDILYIILFLVLHATLVSFLNS